MAILSLHSDQTACGHQLIGHCRSLSRKLTNPEVDAGLLTDVMRRLLFSAKLMFVKVSRSQDLALCDRCDARFQGFVKLQKMKTEDQEKISEWMVSQSAADAK